MSDRPPDIGEVMRRLERLERVAPDTTAITHRIDVQGERVIGIEKNLDRLTSAVESQRELRDERDERSREFAEDIKTKLSEFITETREGFRDQRAFARQIAFLAISSIFGGVGAVVVFFLTRGSGHG